MRGAAAVLLHLSLGAFACADILHGYSECGDYSSRVNSVIRLYVTNGSAAAVSLGELLQCALGKMYIYNSLAGTKTG